MHLLNPLFLLGILGVALPVLIHLMGRRRAPLYHFAAIDFILRSQKRIEARLKLQHLLLLLLRAGVIFLIVLALAKPLLQERGLALAPIGASSSNVFIIDNSFSMNYQTGESTLLAQAKARARELVASLSPSDEGYVLATHSASGGLSAAGGLTPDRARLLESLEGIVPSFYSTPINPSLEKALSLLNGSKKELKRVFLFTDLTQNSWREPQDLSDSFKKATAFLYIIDTARGQPLSNLAITALESSYDWTRKDGKVHLKATIQNFSDAHVKDLLVRVGWGGRPATTNGKGTAQGFLDLPPHSQAVKEFFLDAPGEAVLWGCVEIVESADGGLVADNQRYFALPSVKDMSVLVIDGAPSIYLYQCESFYLERALNPARLHHSYIKPTVIIPREIPSVRFKDFDLVILANVEEMPSQKVAELTSYVKEGGKVLFSLGNNVRTEYYNTSLGELVPKLRMAVESPKESGGLSLGSLDTSHPILRVFAGERSALLGASNFYKVFLIEPQVTGSVSTVLSYSNGAPALLEMSCGKGRSMLFTSTFDRDWTDLPVKPIFLPLIQQICLYLTGNLIEVGPGEVIVGQEWEMPLSQEDASMEVLDPGGNLFSPSIKSHPSRAVVVSQTDYPGIYRIKKVVSAPSLRSRAGSGGPVAERQSPVPWAVFAVNVDPRESDLSRIDPAQLRSSLGEERVGLGLPGAVGGHEGLVAGLRLWPILLITALGLLTMESFVVGRRPS
ncbi:MAG TPA: BatA domain-containing protein [Candidatus Tripitaka californicus]|uniref:BatA domain-containing protein n=1 Tax=Candidatus Tripitaka californicus TaxID=3367616 RepID=UPI004025A014|nr:BatA domain-containing protein [Planctomycetota bacterium]